MYVGVSYASVNKTYTCNQMGNGHIADTIDQLSDTGRRANMLAHTVVRRSTVGASGTTGSFWVENFKLGMIQQPIVS